MPTKKNLPAAAADPWQEEEHFQRLQELARPETPELTSSARRGPARQRPQRRRERRLRGHIVDLRHSMEQLGWKLPETAQLLQLSPRTLRQWGHDIKARNRGLFDVPLGRRAARATPQRRNDVIAVLDEVGPALGVPWLRQAFPDLARAELADILWRYRRVWRKRHYQPLRILHWQIPGSVWAADFAQAPQPIDGIYPYLLAVRDLASGHQLLWLPVRHPDSDEVIQALASLVSTFGAPLVVKTDNGSPFCAGPTRAFLHHFMVRLLFSPPYTPAYNGSIEAAIGSFKTRTEAHASRLGHPGRWNWDDVAYAHAEANAVMHEGPKALTHEQIWQARPPISPTGRIHFQATVERCRDELRNQSENSEWPVGDPLTGTQDRALNRQAIRRALEEHGYLLYSRRRIPLPINKTKVANIT